MSREFETMEGKEIYRVPGLVIIGLTAMFLFVGYSFISDHLHDKDNWFFIMGITLFVLAIVGNLLILPYRVVLYGREYIEVLGALSKQKIFLGDIETIKKSSRSPFGIWIDCRGKRIRLVSFTKKMDNVAWILRDLNSRIDVVGFED